jgi:hypothetical protein
MNRTCAFGVKKERESDKPPHSLQPWKYVRSILLYSVHISKAARNGGVYQIPFPFLLRTRMFDSCYRRIHDKLKCQNGYKLLEKEGKKNSHYRQEIPKNGEG